MRRRVAESSIQVVIGLSLPTNPKRRKCLSADSCTGKREPSRGRRPPDHDALALLPRHTFMTTVLGVGADLRDVQ